MKNLITDFTVFVNEKYSFGPLEEKGPGDKPSTSSLKNKLSIIGSTKSPTKNIDALKAIKDHYKTFSRPIDITGEPSNNNAYFRRAKSTKYEIAPKTEKGNDYIKLGDRILLTGDKTKAPISYQISYRELMLNKELDLEASGNGIYIIGRVLTALVDKKIGLDQNLELYMNLKKPININMDLDTGVQGGGDLNRYILALMVVSEAIVPAEGNKQFPVFVANANRGLGAQAKLYKEFINNGAMPTLSVFTSGPETEEKLSNTSHKAALDATEKIKPYAKKRLSKSDNIKEAQKIYADLYRAFQKPYYEAKGERLKKAIEMECESAGIKIDSFKPIFENIDKWIKQSTSDETAKKEIDKQIFDFGKNNDEDNLYALFHYGFIYDINGPGGIPGLQSKVTKFKGAEGAFR